MGMQDAWGRDSTRSETIESDASGGGTDTDDAAGDQAGDPCRLARDGALLLEEAWPVLQKRARFRAGSRFDADDLLAAAVANVWEKWVGGTGPNTNLVGYITQAMRNRVIDQVRSPRITESSLDVLVRHPVHIDDMTDIDNHREYAWLAAALERLPEPFQRVLRDVVIDGRTPRELEEEYALPAPAISTAVYRAKKKLRAELFQVIVAMSCRDPLCASAQSRAARAVWRAMGTGAEEGGAELEACPACASGVDAYVAMAARMVA